LLPSWVDAFSSTKDSRPPACGCAVEKGGEQIQR
jgi:hypothetical protein